MARKTSRSRYTDDGMSIAHVRTMMPRAWLAVFLCACSSSSADDDGGGGGGSSTLDCAWIQSQNCWKQALDEVAQCIPQPDANGIITTGTLDAAHLTCSYDSGALVHFDEPLMPSQLSPIGITAESAGAQCYRFDRAQADLSLDVGSGPLTVKGYFSASSIGMEISCPDGSSYRTDTYLETLNACEPDPSDWVGTVIEQMGPSHVGLDLAGGNSSGGQIKLFSCDY